MTTSLTHRPMRLARLCGLAIPILVLVGCAPARPVPGAIAPAAARGSNADAEADLRTLDQWEARRAALVREDALLGPGSPRAADLAAAGQWLAFAREAYVAQRRSPAADEAFGEARRLIERIERIERAGSVASTDRATPPPIGPAARSSAAVASYPVHWARAQALAGGGQGTLVRQLVTEVELELARAAVGGPAGSCPLAPHLARAERLLADGESRERQRLARLAADSAARAAAAARLAFIEAVRADDRVRTRAVHFALDRDTLSPASRALLDRVAGALRAHPGLVVALEGHADPRGRAEYNLALSRRRAAAVRDYLAGTGLDVSRIEVKGFGTTVRRSAGHDAQAYARDRRVLVRFSMDDGTALAETDDALDLQVEAARSALRGKARPAKPAKARTTRTRTTTLTTTRSRAAARAGSQR